MAVRRNPTEVAREAKNKASAMRRRVDGLDDHDVVRVSAYVARKMAEDMDLMAYELENLHEDNNILRERMTTTP